MPGKGMGEESCILQRAFPKCLEEVLYAGRLGKARGEGVFREEGIFNVKNLITVCLCKRILLIRHLGLPTTTDFRFQDVHPVTSPHSQA